MKVISADMMRDMDRVAIEERGIPSLDLMEAAGAGVAERVIDLLGDSRGRNVSIFCGKGNNGGDGFVVARYLAEADVLVKVFLLEEPKNLTTDAAVNFEKLPEKVTVIRITRDDDLSEIAAQLPKEDIIIDALLGTGISGPVKDEYTRIIELINSSGAHIVSVDIPSGVEGNTGQIGNVAVWADHTVTLAMPKFGLYLQPGSEYTGTISVVDIGIPDDVIKSFPLNCDILDFSEAKKLLPPRKGISHKGDYGRVLVIGGSRGMAGAMALASESAMRVGCGMVVAASPINAQETLAVKLTEVMTLPLFENSDGTLVPDAVEQLKERLDWADVVAIGPGFGLNADTIGFMGKFLDVCQLPMIVDADGIKCIAPFKDKLTRNDRTVIITPHPGELAYFLGIKQDKILDSYFHMTLDAAKNHGIVVHMKVHRSVTAHPDGRATINITGNSGMASAGSGDVLTGIIAGLLAQGADPYDATRLGAFLHGLSGDMAARELTEYSMIAGDITRFLSNAIMRVVCGE